MSEHVRINESLLAQPEKRLLIAIAHRLPSWVHSDHLTGLAMAAMVAASAGFVLARWDPRALWIVVVALAVNWFGDSLDGTLARVRMVTRPSYGFYIDHVLDIVGITILMVGLAVSPFMSPIIALSLLVAYLLVAGESFLSTAVRNVFKMSFLGVGPTELRIVLAIGVLALRNNPQVNLGRLGVMPLFDFGGLIAIAGLITVLLVSVTMNAVMLARLEPRRAPVTVARGHAALRGRAGRTTGLYCYEMSRGNANWSLRKTAHGSTMSVYVSKEIRHSGDSRPEVGGQAQKPVDRSRGAYPQPQER
jgi:phosphatidylglycerophosphate synthase